jgi:Spy/CpxP family protein refolding chaperone
MGYGIALTKNILHIMKKLLSIIMLLLMHTAAWAQQERFEEIRALKVSFITERLKLTPEQAAQFWPEYNKYQAELREVRRDFRAKYREQNAGATREQAREFINANLDYQTQALELKKKYRDVLLKTISPQQLAQLYDAEREFRKMLIEQLGNSDRKK